MKPQTDERPQYDPSLHVHGHEVNGLNERLFITCDEPGAGCASHKYVVMALKRNGIAIPSGFPQVIEFQNGPISESDVNGISNEVLLAIVRHRLQGFQSGPYACRENAIALTKIEESLHWLHHRTRERVSRGVEGTSKV